jgi:transposase
LLLPLPLPAALLGIIQRAVGDTACSPAWFALAMEAGAIPVVRANPTHKQQEHFDCAAYRRRHKVGNLWARLKRWRAMATRHDKIAASFRNALYRAAAFQWLS